MKQQNLLIPGAIIAAGVIILFVPDLDSSSRMIGFCVALLCATVAALLSGKPKDTDSGTQFKVTLKGISFVHFERARNERPPTTPEVTAVYDEGLEHFHNRRYEPAARLYQRAFALGGEYWPAKVNEGMCYQSLGQFETALTTYNDVILRCPVPRFRRQALGNSGDILMQLAEAAKTKKEAERLKVSAVEKFTAAHASEQTFVSLYNLWDASASIGLTEQAERLLKELQTYPEYEQLPDEQKKPKRKNNDK